MTFSVGLFLGIATGVLPWWSVIGAVAAGAVFGRRSEPDWVRREAESAGLVRNKWGRYEGIIDGRKVALTYGGAYEHISVEHRADFETVVGRRPDLGQLLVDAKGTAGTHAAEIHALWSEANDAKWVFVDKASLTRHERTHDIGAIIDALTQQAELLELDLDGLLQLFLERGAREEALYPRHTYPPSTITRAFGARRWWLLTYILRRARRENRVDDVLDLLTEVDVGPAVIPKDAAKKRPAVYARFVDMLAHEPKWLERIVYEAAVPPVVKGLAVDRLARTLDPEARQKAFVHCLSKLPMSTEQRRYVTSWLTGGPSDRDHVVALMCSETEEQFLRAFETWRAEDTTLERRGRVSITEAEGGELGLADDAGGRLSTSD